MNKIWQKNLSELEANNNLAGLTDGQLVARALGDDFDALAVLVRRHLRLVYSIVKYYLSSSEEAEDVTQEVFIKLWKNLSRFNHKDSFTAWLSVITKNAALDYLKKKRPVPFSNFENLYGNNYLYETIIDAAPNPQEVLINTNTEKELTSAVGTLPLPYQEAVIGHHHDGQTFKEIAQKSHQSVNTIKSRYRRALFLLKKIVRS